MFVACGIWCLADVSSVSPSSEQTVILKAKLKMSCQLNILFGNIPFHFSIHLLGCSVKGFLIKG